MSTLSITMVYYLALSLSSHDLPVIGLKEITDLDQRSGGRTKNISLGKKTTESLKYLSYQILLLIVSTKSDCDRHFDGFWFTISISYFDTVFFTFEREYLLNHHHSK